MTHPDRPPASVPDEQPVANPTDLTNQAALRTGAPSRWLVPAAVFAAIAIVMFALALQLQVVLPVVGIVWVVALWVAMFVVSRRTGDARRRNRSLAWLMGALAVGALLTSIGIYVVEMASLSW